jgi:hypothetical protein
MVKVTMVSTMDKNACHQSCSRTAVEMPLHSDFWIARMFNVQPAGPALGAAHGTADSLQWALATLQASLGQHINVATAAALDQLSSNVEVGNRR